MNAKRIKNLCVTACISAALIACTKHKTNPSKPIGTTNGIQVGHETVQFDMNILFPVKNAGTNQWTWSETNKVETNDITYTFDTRTTNHTHTIVWNRKTNEIAFGESSVYVLNVENLTNDWTNLFILQINSVPIVTVRVNGDVIYDTNNVSEATRVFWSEMTYQARKFVERVK